MPEFLKQISYQQSDPGEDNWHKFHIRLKVLEYEYFIDIASDLSGVLSVLTNVKSA